MFGGAPCNWRIILVSKWLLTMMIISPQDLGNGLRLSHDWSDTQRFLWLHHREWLQSRAMVAQPTLLRWISTLWNMWAISTLSFQVIVLRLGHAVLISAPEQASEVIAVQRRLKVFESWVIRGLADHQICFTSHRKVNPAQSFSRWFSEFDLESSSALQRRWGRGVRQGY